MAPKTIAIRKRDVDPVSPIRDDIHRNNRNRSNNNKTNSNRGSQRSTTARSSNASDTGHYARASPPSDGIMMDPAEHDAWMRLGGAGTQAYAATTTQSSATATVTTATAEETVTTRSTSSSSSTTRQLRQSVTKHELELDDLKEKYEEAKTKMSKMKQEKSTNKKMLLEMSGLITALQDISVDYEQTKKDGNKDNNNSRHKSHLQNVQRKIQAIDTQMRAAKVQCGMLEEEKSLHTTTIKAQETQISALEDQIQFLVQRLEQQSQSNTVEQSELERIIQLQETQIWSLEGQIGMLKRNAKERSIESQSTKLEQQNAARYQEIDSLEEKLGALREAQNAHKIQASLLRSASKSQDSQDTEQNDGEASKEDNEAELSPVKKEVSSWETRHAPSSAPSSAPSPKSSGKKSFGKSARKKSNKVSFGNLSITSESLAAISEEENETSSEATSIPGTSRTSASETTNDATTMDGDDEASSSSSHASSSEDSSTYASSSMMQDSTTAATDSEQRTVTVEHSEDGSVEVMSLQEKQADKKDEAEDASLEASEATQDDRSAVLDADESQRSQRRLLEELEEAKTKYVDLKKDYNSIVSTSTDKVQKLEEEKQELLEAQARAIRSAAEVTESSSANMSRLQQQNDQLRKAVAQKEALLCLSKTKYENLQTEHTQTILELKGKGSQNDDLFSSDSGSFDDRVVDIEIYTRLEQTHEAVVMKLADMGEDNERLECERNAAKEQLETMYSRLQSHDETVLELQKLKESYSLMEEERDATVSKLERMHDRNLLLQGSSEETVNLRQDYADAMARIEVLEKSNEEFGDIEAKFTASEVRVAVLEGELESATEKNKEVRKKLSERESQIRETIGHYKALKQEHARSQTRIKRLESVVESDKQIAANTTKSVGVSENSRTERTSSSAEFSATKMASMTAQLVAYEGQINKLQKQRDAAMEQMKEMEEDLEKAKNESESALEAKKAREKDLRIVLSHYEKLQKKYSATEKEFGDMAQKYEDTVRKIDVLETQINGTEKKTNVAQREIEQLPNWDISPQNGGSEMPNPSLDSQFEPDAIQNKEDQQSSVDDDRSIQQLLHDMEDLKRRKDGKLKKAATEEEDIDSVAEHKESHPPSNDPPSRIDHDEMVKELTAVKESDVWKNEKIARVLCELREAQEQVGSLEQEKSKMQSDLSILKGHLLVAKKESNTAKDRVGNREVNLRNAIAKNYRLQQAYECLETKFNKLQQELVKAHNETKFKEGEAKQARIRASGVHAKFKKLQIDHEAVLVRLESLKQKLEIYETTPEF